MIAGSSAPSLRGNLTFWSIFGLLLLPWLWFSANQATNSDVLWLCDALSRIFSGLTMSQAAYEPNPPLSMLLYTLPVLAQKFLHIPVHYGTYAQTLVLIALSSCAIHAILSKWNVFSETYVNLVTATFILSNTYGVGGFFSERDHLIALGIIPFALIQIAITYNLHLPRYCKWPGLVLGTILILVKPHHGLIPALIIAHRFFKNRNLTPLRDPDFIALAAGCLLYAASLSVFFMDYITIILPDVIALYLPLHDWSHTQLAILTCLICSCILAVGMLCTESSKNEQKMNSLLLSFGLISLIPFYTQGLGLYYHLIPALSFFTMAYAGILQSWLSSAFSRYNLAIPGLIIIFTLSYFHAPLSFNYSAHADYKNTALSKLLAKECPKDKPCSFTMFNWNMAMVHETAYYTGTHYASRFPTLWFWPTLKKTPPVLRQDDRDLKFKKYAEMLAEDFSQQKPDILILYRNRTLKEDFIPYFSKNPDFAKQIRNYKKTETIRMSYDEFYKGIGASSEKFYYDIYKRKTP